MSAKMELLSKHPLVMCLGCEYRLLQFTQEPCKECVVEFKLSMFKPSLEAKQKKVEP